MRIHEAIVVLLLVAPSAWAEPVDDPWAQVPPLPTSCYRENDDFEARAYAASEALVNEKARQEEINAAISQQLSGMDVMDQQQRMVDYMMANPQDAQRFMEVIQAGGVAVQALIPEMAERSGQLETRLQSLLAEYETARQQTISPVKARQEALRASPEWCTPASFIQERELKREENRAYETLCDRWWKEGSPLHAWFVELKEFQVESGARQDEYAGDAKLTFEVMGIAAEEYRGTYYLAAPIEYLRRANQIFSERNYAPVSEELTESCHEHG